MLSEARKMSDAHASAFGVWTHGDIKDVWHDDAGVLCIRYADGCWWHYKDTGSGVEWW